MRFLLVDKILDLDRSQRIVATKYISGAEDFFADHFPGHPIVPGVLLVEMIAQAAGKCLMAGSDPALWPVLLQIRQANFRRAVGPNSELRIEAFIESRTGSTASARGSITVEGQTVADAAVLFGYVPRELLEPGYEDAVLKEYLNTHA